jgi:uncharacterized protein YbaR (Trm112 family)
VALDDFLLDILVCPETREKVTLASAEMLAQLNALVDGGQLDNRAGSRISERMDGALIRADGVLAYAIRGDIPVMLVDEAIPLDQLPT